MKVVHILAGNEDGGLENHTVELCSALQEKGVEVSVIAHKKFKDDFKSVNFMECDLSRSRNNPLILFKLYKLLRKDNFDIIHTQANKATDMVIKLKPFLKSKIVSTLHNYKKDISSFEKADYVITVSDRIGKDLQNQNKMTIYNGIKVEQISNIDLYKKYDIKEDKFIICSIGRFVEAKGFDILLDAMKLVSKKIHLLLIGDGNDLIVKKAMELSNITLCGYLSNKETKKVLKSSKICIISSRREGFSYVFAESLMLNIPLISTDVADIRKFLPEISIVRLDKFDIAKKIDYFSENYESFLEMYKEIFTTAKEEFNLERMVSKTINVYQKVQN